MVDVTDATLAEAEARGRIAMLTEPRAKAVQYDPAIDRVIVELHNGCTFLFPPRLVQGLEAASDVELSSVESAPPGFGLHWEAADVDITVAGLMAGRFGSARYMAERFGSGWNAVAAE